VSLQQCLKLEPQNAVVFFELGKIIWLKKTIETPLPLLKNKPN
jgi:hypothetical protein